MTRHRDVRFARPSSCRRPSPAPALFRALGRRGLALALLALLVTTAPTSRAQSLEESDAPETEDSSDPAEPLDLNRADEAQLLQLPGMDPALARAILACRRAARGFESLEALLDCAGVSPARLAAWGPAVTLDPLPRRRAVAATVGWNERRPNRGDAATGVEPIDGWRRRDYRVAAQAGGLGIAFRLRIEGALSATPPGPFDPAPADTAPAAPRDRTFVLRARPTSALGLTLGDFAPTEALGLLLGVTRRAPARGARSALVRDAALGGWAPVRADALDRAAPFPSGRFMRGGALRVGRVGEVAYFELHPGDTLTPTRARPDPEPARGFCAGIQLAAGRGRGAVLAPRVVQLAGHRWFGAHLTLPLAGGECTLESARDPLRRWRAGVAAWRALGRSGVVQFSHIGGSRRFVNPLGADAAHGLAPGDSLGAARNDNHGETALRVRVRPAPRLTTTLELRGGSDPATRLRAFDRAVSAARLRVEAAAGRGWTLQGDLGLEARDAPGPSPAAEAPTRRPGLSVQAAWQRGRAHLRIGLAGRLDVSAPPGAGRDAAHPPGAATEATLLELRGRWPLSRDVWLGGGLASFHLPVGAQMAAYEERPVDLGAAVTLRGVGQRAHAALSVELPFGTWGVYGVRERKSDSINVLWGSALRIRLESL